MSKIKKPVDIKEFDYFLWKNANGQAYTRIKSTKEVIELTDEIFRFLRAEEKRMYRYIVKNTLKEPIKNEHELKNGNDNEKKEMSEKNITTLLSLDVVTTDEKQNEKWLIDKTSTEDVIVVKEKLEKFEFSLTPKQLDIFRQCKIFGLTATEYAIKTGVSKAFVSRYLKNIEKKYINFEN